MPVVCREPIMQRMTAIRFLPDSFVILLYLDTNSCNFISNFHDSDPVCGYVSGL